jgi:hypothetical protein
LINVKPKPTIFLTCRDGLVEEGRVGEVLSEVGYACVSLLDLVRVKIGDYLFEIG